MMEKACETCAHAQVCCYVGTYNQVYEEAKDLVAKHENCNSMGEEQFGLDLDCKDYMNIQRRPYKPTYVSYREILKRQPKIGDIMDFRLRDGKEVQAMAVRNESDGTVYVFVDCLPGEYPMNEQNTNKGGYSKSDLRKKLNGDILERFPCEIREDMIPFNNGDFLRIPTEKEMFGSNQNGEEDNGTQFEPMKMRRNRIAFQGKNGNFCWYWLQNKIASSTATFAAVTNYGHVNYDNASGSYGVRPCFKLKA